MNNKCVAKDEDSRSDSVCWIHDSGDNVVLRCDQLVAWFCSDGTIAVLCQLIIANSTTYNTFEMSSLCLVR